MNQRDITSTQCIAAQQSGNILPTHSGPERLPKHSIGHYPSVNPAEFGRHAMLDNGSDGAETAYGQGVAAYCDGDPYHVAYAKATHRGLAAGSAAYRAFLAGFFAALKSGLRPDEK